MKTISCRDKNTGRIKQEYDNDEMEQLAKEYSVNRNAREISTREGIPLQTVYYYIRKFNKQKPRRARSINEDYFEKIDTEAKAYILGFIIADGNVSVTSPTNPRPNRLTISVSHVDRSVLELIKEELESECEILDYIPKKTYSKKMMSRIYINSIKICDDLARYGIVPNKTGSERLSELSKDMLRHCIRGFLDGDGHITLRKKGGITLGFSSSSLMILEQIKHTFKDHLSLEGIASIQKDHRKDSFNLRYHSQEDIQKLKNYLYKDSTVFLERKFFKL